jgi:hypothetical protein
LNPWPWCARHFLRNADWTWWHTQSVTPGLGRLRQGDGEFEANLGYKENLPQKKEEERKDNVNTLKYLILFRTK